MYLMGNRTLPFLSVSMRAVAMVVDSPLPRVLFSCTWKLRWYGLFSGLLSLSSWLQNPCRSTLTSPHLHRVPILSMFFKSLIAFLVLQAASLLQVVIFLFSSIYQRVSNLLPLSTTVRTAILFVTGTFFELELHTSKLV